MPIIHRYLEELDAIEQNQIFCNEPIAVQSNILIIGTFNPSDESCENANDATWFYGRNRNKFWRYFPTALTGQSLHQTDNQNGNHLTWRQYCVQNGIVIIDLVKSININDILSNFGDRAVECKINHDLTNTNYFNIDQAFHEITFNKVIYSLLWSDRFIVRLRNIRDIINNRLIENHCIQNVNQIKYCMTPARNNAINSWNNAVNN